MRPSYQRQDRLTLSLYYFNAYALKNCIDISEMSDNCPSSIDISPDKILPSQLDIEIMTGEYEIFISRYAYSMVMQCLLKIVIRILTRYMPEFYDDIDKVISHIPFSFSKEMSCKSEVVSTLSHILCFVIYYYVGTIGCDFKK